ncbi:DUF4349 domain-containing protein [Cohnella luojiensis]|uniref:DUF4349 domain-containing protein n=1 Tax=Cohnella luojiensis TaxID=652876 RepID=A0A4Y8M6V1_9BACL|nr:DUF4349 domain-containing protein [Cohnella luojiensis]TFE31726.1 DUF4349 domain-containing protein [Cohnella luojiensis]
MKGKRGRGLRIGILLMMVVILLTGSLTACSGSDNDSDSAAPAALEQAAPAEGMMNNSDQKLSSSVQKSVLTSADSAAAPAEAPQASASSGTSAAGSGGGIGPIADANAGFGRKVIYRANLVMKVEEFRVAEERLLDLIHLGGAYVLQFSDSRNTDEVGATYVIKVPSEGFSPFLEKLQKIKSLKFDREVEGNDVTEEFVDLEARLKAKQVVESRLLSFMDKATKTNDLVMFSNELARVQEELEQIKGRMRFLDQNVAFSTINLRLYQANGIEEVVEVKAEEKEGFADRISDALTGSTRVLRQFGEGILVVIAAMLPVLIVVTAIGVPAYYFVRKRSSARRIETEEKRKSWNKTLIDSADNDQASPVAIAEEALPESHSGQDEQEPKDGGR